MKLMAQAMALIDESEEMSVSMINFIDLSGSMRMLSLIARNCCNQLAKVNPAGVGSIQLFLETWKGFTKQTTDFSKLEFTAPLPTGQGRIYIQTLIRPIGRWR